MPAHDAASEAPVLVWFRQDLRLADNPALAAAAKTGRPVVPVFVQDDSTPGEWVMGNASRFWLHASLEALTTEFRRLGITLVFPHGDATREIPALARKLKAHAVYWNDCVEPYWRTADRQVRAALAGDGIGARCFNAGLLFNPDDVVAIKGSPYRVFTPFWKACRQSLPAPGEPLRMPARLKPCRVRLLAREGGAYAFADRAPGTHPGASAGWSPGEAGAQARLADFIDNIAAGYAERRDRPDREGTSRLSPHLHWGEVSARQVFHAVHAARDAGTIPERDAEKFLAELGWREFSQHLLYHFPDLPERNFQRQFDVFPWRTDRKQLRQWQAGKTGYPFVDAGMRELAATGWMHNRVRMVAASFLVKHLLIDWREGARWFADTLVDADLANNAANWQWVAGSGTDAAPYFRIFNPVIQSKKFDPDAAYIRRWVPELRGICERHIHAPWQAPAASLKAGGVELGKTYPAPIVEHDRARRRALDAYEETRSQAA